MELNWNEIVREESKEQCPLVLSYVMLEAEYVTETYF